jgi:hypothetical protein
MTSVESRSSFVSRGIKITATLTCVLAMPATIIGVSRLAHIYMEYYIRAQTGHAMPRLTMAVLGLVDRFMRPSGMVAVAAAIVCLAAAYLLARSATTAEGCSVRLLALTSGVWIFCFLFLAIATLAFALPFLDHFP